MNDIYNVLIHRVEDTVISNPTHIISITVYFHRASSLLIWILGIIFSSVNIYSSITKLHIMTIIVWFHNLFFHIVCVHFYRIVPVRNECVHVCLVCTKRCPAHVAKFSLRESHCLYSQTSDRGFYPTGLQIYGNLKMLYLDCRLDGISLPNQIFYGFPSLVLGLALSR